MALSSNRCFRILTAAAGLGLAAAAVSGCENPGGSPPADPGQALIAHGRAVYQSVCIACHNADPHKPGSLGPDVWGSSLELITARVMKAEYPPGYKPKRQTHVMQALPQLEKDLPAIRAYLNAP